MEYLAAAIIIIVSLTVTFCLCSWFVTGVRYVTVKTQVLRDTIHYHGLLATITHFSNKA